MIKGNLMERIKHHKTRINLNIAGRLPLLFAVSIFIKAINPPMEE
jgi:hypothetical protein